MCEAEPASTVGPLEAAVAADKDPLLTVSPLRRAAFRGMGAAVLGAAGAAFYAEMSGEDSLAYYVVLGFIGGLVLAPAAVMELWARRGVLTRRRLVMATSATWILTSLATFFAWLQATYTKSIVPAGDYKGAYDSTDPQMQQALTLEQFQETFEMIDAGTGPLQSRSTTSFNINRKTSGGVAKVTFSAVFAKGSGTIRATFSDSSGAWRVVGWRVESPLLLPLLTCKKCKAVSKSLVKFCPSCGESMADSPK